MNDKLILALEECLMMLDQGSSLESCLLRYPEHADELRPILLAAVDAKSIAEDQIPVDAMRRSRSKFLDAAAEIREQKISRKTAFGFSWQRVFRLGMALLLAVILVAGVGGTGLVNASNGSLPGDRLYPVKLTWEDIRLKLALSQADRVSLEKSYENERVDEINHLIDSNRSEKIKFFGQVEDVQPDQISVSGIRVVITPETRIEGEILPGVWTRVEGETRAEGVVSAVKIKVESREKDSEDSSGADSSESSGKENNSGNSRDNAGDKSGKSGSQDSTGTSKTEDSNQNSGKPSSPKAFEIEGTVSGYSGDTILINNQMVLINDKTELRDQPLTGSVVKIRGYVDENGRWIATRIEVQSASPSGGGENNSSGSGKNEATKTPKP